MEWLRNITENIMMFLMSRIITIPFLKKPFQDLKHPTRSYAMENAMNVRINVEDDEQIGGWFLQPIDYNGQALPKSDDEQFAESKKDDFLVDRKETVILYLHGNAETRAQYHRRALYRLFQKMGYHVLAIDYRGYGDSSKKVPNQTSMVKDAHAAFNWLNLNSHQDCNIFVWGHSLGTGVTSKLSQELTEKDENEAMEKFKGIFLEAPFNCMTDEVKSFKLSRILNVLGLDVQDVLEKADVEFNSTKWLKYVKKPIFIFHAEDDEVIPFPLAQKMSEDLAQDGVNVEFYPFHTANQKLGHDGIFLVKNPRYLTEIVPEFVEKALRSKSKL